MKKTFTFILALTLLTIFGSVNAQNNNGVSTNTNANSNANVNATGSAAAVDTSVFGNGFWNVYCYNGLLIPNSNKAAVFTGSYTENNLTFYSSSRWNETSTPEKANASTGKKYTGTSMDSIHTVSYKRTGFSYGVYQIDVPWYDNNAFLYINGSLVWSKTGCCKAFLNVWKGTLDQNTTIEFKWVNFEKGSSGSLKITPVVNTALPVSFAAFDATKEENIATLNWATASEQNNDFFTVEKSKDGINFEMVTTVKGAGNSTTILNYSATDKLTSGTSYYRIKQTDYNGNNSYSEVVNVNFNSKNSLQVSPNPANSGETLMIALPSGDNASVTIRDMQGLEYFTTTVDTNSEVVSINSPMLAPGMYIVVATSNNEVYSQKIIIR